MITNFNHPLYGKNKPFEWKSSLINAEKIICSLCINLCSVSNSDLSNLDLYSMLCSDLFNNELNLHNQKSDKLRYYLELIDDEYSEEKWSIEDKKFFKDHFYQTQIGSSSFLQSGLGRKEYYQTLAMSNWDFKDVLLSAFFYFLQNCSIQNDPAAKVRFSQQIMNIFWNKRFTKSVINLFIFTRVLDTTKAFYILNFQYFFSGIPYIFEKKNGFFYKGHNFTKKNFLLFFRLLNISDIIAIPIINKAYQQNSFQPINNFLYEIF